MGYKDWNLKTKLFTTISLTTTLTLAVIIIIIGLRISKLVKDDSSEIASNMSDKWSIVAKEFLEAPLLESRSFAKLIEGQLNSGTKKLSREQANAMLKHHILNSPNYLGISLCFEPDAFDGLDSLYRGTPGHDNSGRFIPYWTKGNGQGLLEALVDYEVEGAGDWYLLPKKTGKEVILEPFSYSIEGKPVLITSLMVPMNIAEKFAGTAGIDISINNIVDRFNQISFHESGHLVLFTESGTIIASKEQNNLNKKIVDITSDKDYIDAVLNKTKIITQVSSSVDG